MLNSVGFAGDLIGFLGHVLRGFLEFSISRSVLLEDSNLVAIGTGSIPCYGVLCLVGIGSEVEACDIDCARIGAELVILELRSVLKLQYLAVRQFIACILHVDELFAFAVVDEEANLGVRSTFAPREGYFTGIGHIRIPAFLAMCKSNFGFFSIFFKKDICRTVPSVTVAVKHMENECALA